MIPVSEQFASAIYQDGRSFSYALYVNGGSTDYGENVASVDIQAECCNGRGLTIGTFNKTKCRLVLYWDDSAVWTGSFVQMTMMIDGAPDVIKLGKFWVYEERMISSGKTELTCYDVPPVMNEKFESSSTLVSEILTSITSLTGMAFVSTSPITLEAITAVQDNATYADVLALIAGYDELSVRATRDGMLQFFRFTTPDTPITDESDAHLVDQNGADLTATFREIQSPASQYPCIMRDQIFDSGYSADKEPMTIGAVTYSDGEQTYTMGSGYGITYTNPYFTREHMQALGYYLGAVYRPVSLRWRGNPAFEVGDIVPLEMLDGTFEPVYIMAHEITIDGGFSARIRCYADRTDQRAGIYTSPTDRKIGEAKTEIFEQVTNQTKLLNGGLGGFSKWHYLADGTPSELLFMDQPDEARAVHILRINRNGIGFSSDGGVTYSTAWTLDGKFNASFITTGILRAIDIIGSTIEGSRFLSSNGQYNLNIWAGVITLMANENIRACLYQTASSGELVLMNGSSKDVNVNPEDGSAVRVSPTGVQAYVSGASAGELSFSDQHTQLRSAANLFLIASGMAWLGNSASSVSVNENGSVVIQTPAGKITVNDGNGSIVLQNDSGEISLSEDGTINLINDTVRIRLHQTDGLGIWIGGIGYTGLHFVDDGNGHAVLGI